MNVEYKDFIGVYSDVFPEGFCEHLVSEFERLQAKGAGWDRQSGINGVPKHRKNDCQIFCNMKNVSISPFEETGSEALFFKGLQECFEAYTNEFSILKTAKLSCTNIKMQKTCTGGGYHVWHGEKGEGAEARRSLVYMLYLNTLPKEANGETEFLYQQRRINPVGNTMVLWPAGFTHAHRGNPVYGENAKYIVTGWFYHE